MILVTSPGQATMNLRYLGQSQVANKNKGAANKSVANMDAEVIANVAKMLDKHHDQFQNALQERYDQMINGLQYDLVSILNRSNVNNLMRREVQTKSKSPFDTLETIDSNLTRETGTFSVRYFKQSVHN